MDDLVLGHRSATFLEIMKGCKYAGGNACDVH